MYYLTVGAIFKNEAHVMEEWLLNHLNEGVEHFYLINNGSTDNFMPIIRKYRQYITLFNDNTKHAQIKLYNKYFLPIKNDSKWMMIIDLDEFVYSRNGYETIPDYLKTVNRVVSKITLFWKMYGSSGFIKQPDGIIHNFVNRSKSINIVTGLKQIVNTSLIIKFDIHEHRVYNDHLCVSSNNRVVSIRNKDYNLSDTDTATCLSNSSVHLNHYRTQSYEWFKNVKMTRGDVYSSEKIHLRTNKYFKEYDTNDVFDNELSLKIGDLELLKEKYTNV